MRLKEAEIFLVAIQSQDIARVVTLEEMLVVLVWDGGRILRKLQQILQPLSVLVQAEEGEVKRAAPCECVDFQGELLEQGRFGGVGQDQDDVHVPWPQAHQVTGVVDVC